MRAGRCAVHFRALAFACYLSRVCAHACRLQLQLWPLSWSRAVEPACWIVSWVYSGLHARSGGSSHQTVDATHPQEADLARYPSLEHSEGSPQERLPAAARREWLPAAASGAAAHQGPAVVEGRGATSTPRNRQATCSAVSGHRAQSDRANNGVSSM